ncbi:hypothetical protein G4B88_023598 [Cannabis sativa]|uniref:Protein COFACTOR ASSEMBLY OF COMPLEX C SUBUNIT B CCB1, chloroplastic n=1 Tax=Cannabis sativa TaxID=3483 RepID=A0A7J6HUM7_CANSA|nr:hypothetical protein G4B88_023598 [Cannabis sativa]
MEVSTQLFSKTYPHTQLLTLPTSFSDHHNRRRTHPWLPITTRSNPTKLILRSSLQETLSIAANLDLQQQLLETSSSSSSSSLFLVSESVVGYSLASYYTSLGLFVISIVKKTFIGEGDEAKKAPNQVAGEILSFFTRNNFAVTDRGETITFEGVMTPSRGQAALLTFCTCISLASVALVLTITYPDVGNNWFWLTILSPLAGAYYWKRATRTEQIKVKMIVGEDGELSEVIVQGDDQQVDQLRRELKLSEKGMVYVKGIFER